MGFTTFKQAKAWVSPGYGECDDFKVGRAVNKIREHFYNWYSNLELFLDAIDCFRVHDFCVDCNPCNERYRGITLPREFQTVEAMWFNDYPVQLRSEWREFQIGISHECDCRLVKYDVPGTFPTVADLDPLRPTKLRVRAFDVADRGKRFVIRGIAGTGQPVTEEFKLSDDVQLTGWEIASIDQRGGIIKDVTDGRVVLAEESGRLLGMYEPDETIPAYRRIKITGLPDHCQAVNVRAARKYFQLHAEEDIVETDSEVIFDAMARYLKSYEMATKTRESLGAEKDFYATALNMMTGVKSRERGKASQASVSIAVPSFGGGSYSKLNRMGRRRPW